MDNDDTNKIFDEVTENNLPPVDTSKFLQLNSDDLIDILGLTIKRDEINKAIAFLAQLSAYTDHAQLNISFNAPSSSGKSFIPTEIAKLFPKEDVIEVGYCSPTAFFHQVGTFDKEKQGYIVDLSRKILIFLDQPHTLLLQHLRPMLSHDKKEILLKITDKSQKAGLRTKNIFLRGFPVVIFCSAGLRFDEQEATRFLLLSPETNTDKIKDAIFEKIKKESDNTSYSSSIELNPQRILLKDRIAAIRMEKIEDVKIPAPEEINRMFLERAKSLKPRHQRDIDKVMSLIKVIALLNLWHRTREGFIVTANEFDVQEAFKLWDEILESQELGIPPYVYDLYRDIIVPAYQEKNGGLEGVVGKMGITRQEIMQKHYDIKGRFLAEWFLRQQVLPPLETCGLINQEPDQNDKRKMLIFPTSLLTISKTENNSESDGGDEVASETVEQEGLI